MYDYSEARPQLQTALQGAKSIYEGSKGTMGCVSATRLAYNANPINAIGFAEKYAVMLDVLSTLVLMETVVGVWAAALQVLATGADAKDLIKACVTS